MDGAFIDLTIYDINSQDIGSIVAGIVGGEASVFTLALGILLPILVMLILFKSKVFEDKNNLIAGISIGVIVSLTWYISAGELGLTMLDEADMMEGDEKPFALGVQALTFVQPSAHTLRLIETGFNNIFITFALIAAVGVLLGSFVYALFTKGLKIEWFQNIRDFVNHILSGLLMGFGGVLALGCTIGQGVSGVSTLALGSFLALGSIILGSALTMKITYYSLVYEEKSNFYKALVSSLVDFKLLPKSLRQLENV